MGFLEKIRRHAAVASGNFASMFKGVKIPPLSDAVVRLLAEINRPEPDVTALARILSSTTDMAAQVLKTVNSALYGLRHPVTDLERAVTLLGLDQIRSMALAYGAMRSLPPARHSLFNDQAFWNDSLLRPIFSRTLSEKSHRGRPEEAFTASLLADIALPVLLDSYGAYYAPVLEEWQRSALRLSKIEQRHFNWDHAQAGAWILHAWNFPEEIVCFIGMHNLPWEEIRHHQLEDTAVAPIAVAAITSSVLKPNPERAQAVWCAARDRLDLDAAGFLACVEKSEQSFNEIRELFGFSDLQTTAVFTNLRSSVSAGSEEVPS